MRHQSKSRRPVRAAFFVLCLALAAPAGAYHLQLEAQPGAVFPYFAKFGTIDLHVSTAGVRADSVWLDAFSRAGSDDVTVINPLIRMYTDMPIAQVAAIVGKLGSGTVERQAVATLGPVSKGRVGKLPATRHRLVYGDAHIDYWTTSAVPENAQLRRIVHELLMAVSPGTAAVARNIRGNPVYVELNFERFRKVPLVRLKGFSQGNDELAVGPWFLKVPSVDILWK
ncbi:MAG TPA: hypothetical protein VFT12_11780 [Thermoanaerobaculia bacterium]|nr:hypothetical protein [Thermoanaerobaculia bacterium]